MPVTLTVLRDGYFNCAYARVGDAITVDDEWVEQLELAGFAMRQAAALPAADPSARPPKGSKHGR